MARRYKSVSEMVRHLTEDEQLQKEFEEGVHRKALAKTLFAMRCAHGLTQAQMAERLGCTQGRISKLENSEPDSIRVSDLMAYAQALDLQVSIGFHRGITAVESVKFHAFQIKKELDDLAKLAQQDDEIRKGVSGFFSEAFMNILRLFQQSASLLPKAAVERRAVPEITAPTETEEVMSVYGS